MLPDALYPPTTYTYHDRGDEFTVSETYDLGPCTVDVSRPNALRLNVTDYDDIHRAVWTVVPWARDVGIPGTWKEDVYVDGDTYRLGALYRYAGYDLRDRESDYATYGENPEYDVS